MWEQMTRGEFVLENYEQFLTARPSILVTDCKSLYDAIHKEGAAPASTDKRLAIELAIVKAKAVSGETDLRWIDGEISNCRLLDETRLKKVRGSPTENSAGSTVENYCRRGHAGQTQTRARDSQQFSLRRRIVAYERMTCKGNEPCTSYPRTIYNTKMATDGYVNAYTFTHNNITLEHNAMNNKNTIAHMDVHNTRY